MGELIIKLLLRAGLDAVKAKNQIGRSGASFPRSLFSKKKTDSSSFLESASPFTENGLHALSEKPNGIFPLISQIHVD